MGRWHPPFRRPDEALLAGVCATVARRLGWNVWALRALAVLGLIIQAPATGVLYLVLALLLPWMGDSPPESHSLEAPELSERSRRIEDLERRFRDLEQNSDRR